MPPQIAFRAQKIGRYVFWSRNALLVTIVLALALSQSLHFSQIGVVTLEWPRNLLIGIVAGSLRVGLQGLTWRIYSAPDFLEKRLAAEHIAYWAFSQLLSVLGEELWIAFCLVALIRTDHSVATAVALTATVFGALHFPYRSGAIVIGMYGAISACLFLWSGSLLPSFLFHYIGNLGSYYWARGASQIV
jgi:membrane protease YdiL (CAAX protease family)